MNNIKTFILQIVVYTRVLINYTFLEKLDLGFVF